MWTAYLNYWIVMICGFLFICSVYAGNWDERMAIRITQGLEEAVMAV